MSSSEILKTLPKSLAIVNDQIDLNLLSPKELAKMSPACQKIFVIMVSNIYTGNWQIEDYKKMRSALVKLADYVVQENNNDLVRLLQAPKEVLVQKATDFLPPSCNRETYITEGKVEMKDIIAVVNNVVQTSASITYDAAICDIDRRIPYSEELNREITSRMQELEEFTRTEECSKDSFIAKAYYEFYKKFASMCEDELLSPFVVSQRNMIPSRLNSALKTFQAKKLAAHHQKQEAVHYTGRPRFFVRESTDTWIKNLKIKGL